MIFKTSEADRSRLFDHIYEKIKNVKKEATIENEQLQMQLKRYQKRIELLSVNVDQYKEQVDYTQHLCKQVDEANTRTTEKVRSWYEDYLVKV